jgi:hypothetical protein
MDIVSQKLAKKKCYYRHNFIVILLQEINKKISQEIRGTWLGRKTPPQQVTKTIIKNTTHA